MEVSERVAGDGRRRADHLCVLIHGLWGNPEHMAHLASALRERYPEDKLHILKAKTNSDNYTYDGIDLGGERVTQEVERYIAEIERDGGQIKKISIVGYSLGGLVARYAIGLLYSNGWFDKIEPVNFITFASPHLGVRTPVLGVHSHLFNLLGSRTLSTSGRQLFTIDRFRDMDRPLLSVLADPTSIFMLALSQFKHRILYANIINDRSTPYYTSSISTTDPYKNLDAVDVNYLPDYSPVILHPDEPVTLKPAEAQPQLLTRVTTRSQSLLAGLPLFALLCVAIPIGSILFLINSGVQSIRSQKRIRLHEQGKAGIGLGSYRIPFLVENARQAMEGAFGSMNAGQDQHYLPETATDDESDFEQPQIQQDDQAEEKPLLHTQPSKLELKRTSSRHADFPTLALTSEQFAMVRALNDVGFRKHRVHIHNARHSHAAIILRHPQRQGLSEGKVVARHWLDNEFEI